MKPQQPIQSVIRKEIRFLQNAITGVLLSGTDNSPFGEINGHTVYLAMHAHYSARGEGMYKN
jgi:hypothetical protein